LLEEHAGMIEGDCLQEGFRGKPRPSREELMEPCRLHAHPCCDGVQGGLLARILRQEFDDLPNNAVIAAVILLIVKTRPGRPGRDLSFDAM
jgi:hypothetical protein